MKNEEECEADCECYDEKPQVEVVAPKPEVDPKEDVNPLAVPYIPSAHVQELMAKKEKKKKEFPEIVQKKT